MDKNSDSKNRFFLATDVSDEDLRSAMMQEWELFLGRIAFLENRISPQCRKILSCGVGA